MSGYRIGCAYSINKSINAILGSLFFTQASAPIQHALGEALCDAHWVDKLISTNRTRLRANYSVVCARLSSLGVPVHAAQGGFFVWIDLRRALPAADAHPTPLARELALCDLFLNEGVYITPGMGFHAAEPGWARFCFALKPDVLTLALDRLERVLSRVK